MKLLTSLILTGLLVMATSTFAQDTNSGPDHQRPTISEHQGGGFHGPALQRGWDQQQRGEFRGPPQGRPEMSQNDNPAEWEKTLEARRDGFRHQLSPNGPYGQQGPAMEQRPWQRPQGPMLRGGPQHPPMGPKFAQGGPRAHRGAFMGQQQQLKRLQREIQQLKKEIRQLKHQRHGRR